MPKGSSKSTAAIQRLLEERRQYEAWIARLDAEADATPQGVRSRVRADYEARLKAVLEELKVHAEAARQIIAQRAETLTELARKEKEAAERLKEAELRHAVGEYDEAQWTQVHKDVLAELVSVRQEIQAAQADIEKLEELDALVRAKGRAPARPAADKKAVADELAFLKSVTEDEQAGPSPRRASGAQFQPAAAAPNPRPAPAPTPSPFPGDNLDEDAPKTLKCRECGTMNLPTEWYCENCGAELAAL